MKSPLQSLIGRRLPLAAIAVLVLAAPALAVVVVMDTTTFINGVDATGNLSSDNGGEATGKVFKDTNTGILLEVVSGIVINETRYRKLSYPNQGVTVTDPGSSQTFTATADLEVVYAPFAENFAFAGRVAVFVPTRTTSN
jgi:hypothetical protein